jgi:hypothetical protein
MFMFSSLTGPLCGMVCHIPPASRTAESQNALCTRTLLQHIS